MDGDRVFGHDGLDLVCGAFSGSDDAVDKIVHSYDAFDLFIFCDDGCGRCAIFRKVFCDGLDRIGYFCLDGGLARLHEVLDSQGGRIGCWAHAVAHVDLLG